MPSAQPGTLRHVQRDAEQLEPEADAACWLSRVCDACGGVEDGPPAPSCPRCGAERSAED